MIRGLLFDFDGVIADSLEPHMAAWQQLLPALGVVPESAVLRQHEGEPAWRIATEFFARAGRTLDPEQARQLAAAKNELFRGQPPPPVYPELPAILDWAELAGVKKAVVTGTVRQNIEHVIGPLMLRFEAIIGDGEYPRPKPHPDPYLAGARRLNLAPGECVVIENAPMGIRAAKAAGIFCVALETTLEPSFLQMADLILPGHAALLKWLQEGEK